MSKYAKHTSTRVTPQSEPIPGSSQVPNSAGGHAFAVDCWTRLERFLVLGAEGGTYYIKERALSQENATAVNACAAEDPVRTVNMIVEISEEGLAPKQTPAIFALAALAGHRDLNTRKLALNALPRVCRIGTHLFEFVSDVTHFRGWGRSLRTAVSNWYLDKEPRQLAYQVTKYQQRGGESHRDVIRRAHPTAMETDLNEVLRYVARKQDVPDTWLSDDKPHRQLLAAVEEAKKADTAERIVHLIQDYGLVRECIPTQWLNDPKVWEALLVKMPMTALIRNLGKMTSIGLIAPMSNESVMVCDRLANTAALQKSRVHPFSVLLALTTYTKGEGVRGSLKWNAMPQVQDALDDAFYASFGNIVPTGKRWLLGLDVSGSMECPLHNTHITYAMGTGAMAMVAMRTEPAYYCHGFSGQFVDLGLTAKMTLGEVMRKISRLNFGSTDCALPMIHALREKIPVDIFCIMTDNETWAGSIHPLQALQQYRERMGISAKLIVVGMASNGFTIADPNDSGMLDVVGFDASAPTVMANFARDDS